MSWQGYLPETGAALPHGGELKLFASAEELVCYRDRLPF